MYACAGKVSDSVEENRSKRKLSRMLYPKLKKMAKISFCDVHKSCRLPKAIYGPKQSGRQFYKRLELRKLGRVSSQPNPCVYKSKREASNV